MPRTDRNGRVSFATSLLVPFSCAAALFLLLYIIFLSHLWGDQAFLMYAARQVLAGVRLDGPRLVETNPPMVVWFSIVPVSISRGLHLLPDYALWGTVLAMIVASATWSYRLLGRSDLRISPWILTVLIAAVEFIIQPALFGQKEQITVALLMPFIIAAATHPKGMSQVERISMGICAGLGVCFKPHQLLVLVVLECFLLVRQRSLRRLLGLEIVVAVMTGIVYLCCVWSFTPYLQEISPVLRDTYWALGNRTFAQLLRGEARSLTLGLVFACCAIALLRKKIDTAFPAVFLACGIGATLAFYIQHTGWSYQAFPAHAFLTLVFFVLLLEWSAARAGGSIRYVRLPAMVWAAALVLPVLAFSSMALRARHAHPVLLDAELERLPEGTTVYVFSIEMSQFRVLLDHHLVWGSRFAHQWMMPAIIQNEYPRRDISRPFKALGVSRTEYLAGRQRVETAEDFARWQPQYVFVEKCDGAFYCSIYNHPMNFIGWYSQAPAFASEWSHYRFVKTINNFDLYQRNG